MSALLKAAQARADAENAQEYVDYARTKKLIIQKCFPSSKELYDGSSKFRNNDRAISHDFFCCGVDSSDDITAGLKST